MSDDSEPSSQQEINERQTGEQTNPQEEIPSKARWGMVGGAFFVGGILGAVANPAEPLSGFFVIGLIVGGVAWSFATKSGKKFRTEFMENMEDAQQQQASSSSSPKVVCSNCGWKNPKTNNYCHDCGEQLDQ